MHKRVCECNKKNYTCENVVHEKKRMMHKVNKS